MGEVGSKSASFRKRELRTEALQSRLAGDLSTACAALEALLREVAGTPPQNSGDSGAQNHAGLTLAAEMLEQGFVEDDVARGKISKSKKGIKEGKRLASLEERLELAFLLDALGNVMAAKVKEQGKQIEEDEEEPLELIMAGLKLRQQCHECYPGNQKVRTMLARSYSSIATYYHAKNEAEKADKAHLEALKLFDHVPLQTKASQADLLRSAKGFLSVQTEFSSPVLEMHHGNKGGEVGSIDSWEDFRKNKLKKLKEKIKDQIKKAGSHSDGMEETELKHDMDDESFKMTDAFRGSEISSPTNLAPSSEKSGERKKRQRAQQRSHVAKLTLIKIEKFQQEDKELMEGQRLQPLQVSCSEEEAPKESKIAESLDEVSDHIPSEIALDPEVHDVIHFGRQPYKDALEFFQSRMQMNRSSQKRIGFVRLDSASHDRLISRRHAQIKLSRVHPLIPKDDLRVSFEDEKPQTGELPKFGTSKSDMPSPSDKDLGKNENEDDLAWVIRDLESTNGILVNGVRIQEFPLRNGDIVSFGGATSVAFGCAVLTHKRRPVSSVFVYRFEEDGPNFSEELGLEGNPNSELELYTSAFLQSRLSSSVDGIVGDSTDLHRFHFFMLFVSEFKSFHLDQDMQDFREVLLQAVQESANLYHQATNEAVPYKLWSSWIRAKIRRFN